MGPFRAAAIDCLHFNHGPMTERNGQAAAVIQDELGFPIALNDGQLVLGAHLVADHSFHRVTGQHIGREIRDDGVPRFDPFFEHGEPIEHPFEEINVPGFGVPDPGEGKRRVHPADRIDQMNFRHGQVESEIEGEAAVVHGGVEPGELAIAMRHLAQGAQKSLGQMIRESHAIGPDQDPLQPFRSGNGFQGHRNGLAGFCRLRSGNPGFAAKRRDFSGEIGHEGPQHSAFGCAVPHVERPLVASHEQFHLPLAFLVVCPLFIDQVPASAIGLDLQVGGDRHPAMDQRSPHRHLNIPVLLFPMEGFHVQGEGLFAGPGHADGASVEQLALAADGGNLEYPAFLERFRAPMGETAAVEVHRPPSQGDLPFVQHFAQPDLTGPA